MTFSCQSTLWAYFACQMRCRQLANSHVYYENVITGRRTLQCVVFAMVILVPVRPSVCHTSLYWLSRNCITAFYHLSSVFSQNELGVNILTENTDWMTQEARRRLFDSVYLYSHSA